MLGYFPHLAGSFSAGAFDPQGHRFRDYITRRTDSSVEFSDAWRELRQRVAGQGVAGPLDTDSASAGRDSHDHLQRRITEQVEQVERDALNHAMLQLPTTDTRRLACAVSFTGARPSSP